MLDAWWLNPGVTFLKRYLSLSLEPDCRGSFDDHNHLKVHLMIMEPTSPLGARLCRSNNVGVHAALGRFSNTEVPVLSVDTQATAYERVFFYTVYHEIR